MAITGAMMVKHEHACIASVRRELSLDLDLHGADVESVEDAALVLSELMGNALRHGGVPAGDQMDVSWTLRRREVLIAVEDRASDLPRVVSADRSASSGRGLAIVSALSTDWGHERIRTGKRVWARVPLRSA